MNNRKSVSLLIAFIILFTSLISPIYAIDNGVGELKKEALEKSTIEVGTAIVVFNSDGDYEVIKEAEYRTIDLDKHDGGFTAYGALEATTDDFVGDDYVTEIMGIGSVDESVPGSKWSGWMYSYNDNIPEDGMKDQEIEDGDKIVFYRVFNFDNDQMPKWDDVVERENGDKENILSEKLNLETHIDYIEGYEDGTIRGAQNITREEVAAMIYRVLNPTYRVDIETNEHDFKDLSKDAWSSKYVATLSKGNILKGYPDGSFNGKNPLTRAEATVMLTRFLDEETENEVGFKDINNHWAEKEISLAVDKGWIKGYEDDTFKPNNNITRGELVTIINRVLEREAKLENMLEGRKEFKDLSKTDWYYEAIQEAANGHTYERVDGVEVWKSLKEFK